jgi:hypothetical protein
MMGFLTAGFARNPSLRNFSARPAVPAGTRGEVPGEDSMERLKCPPPARRSRQSGRAGRDSTPSGHVSCRRKRQFLQSCCVRRPDVGGRCAFRSRAPERLSGPFRTRAPREFAPRAFPGAWAWLEAERDSHRFTTLERFAGAGVVMTCARGNLGVASALSSRAHALSSRAHGRLRLGRC